MSKEYIEKEAALEIIQSISPPSWDAISRTAAYCEIKYLPPADVKPVVKAKWIPVSEVGHCYPFYKCSHCSKTNGYETKFCPNCGADMRKEDET